MKFNLEPENINYIKIVYKDSEDFSHCIKAAVKSINSKDIFASTKYEDNLFIKTPQEVELSIACDNGLYTSKTILRHIEKEEPYIFFSIKVPEEITYKQNREYFRVKLSEKATVDYLDGEETKSIDAEIYDISANGVRLVIEQHLNFPEDVQITFHFPDKEIHTLAKTIRTDEDDKIIKYSFALVDLSVPDSDYISRICLKKQLEQRKNKLL